MSQSRVYAQSGPSLIVAKQVSNSTPAPGQKFTYLIRYRCAGIEENCLNAQITDVVPSALTIVDYSRAGGNIANGAQNGNTLIWDLANVLDTEDELQAGATGTIQVDVRFPACGDQLLAAGSLLSNTASFTADNATTANSPANGADVTVPTINPCDVPEEIIEEGFRKTDWDEIFANPGNQRVTYEIFLVNSPAAYVLEDMVPNGLTLESVDLSNLITSGGSVDLRCGGTWYDLTPTLDDRLNAPTDVHPNCVAEQAFATTAAFWFTNAEGIRFHVPAGFTADPATPIDLLFSFDGDYPVGGTIRNTAILTEPVGVDLNGDAVLGDVLISHVDKTVVEPSLMGSIEVNEFILPGYLNQEGISILDGNKNLPGYVANSNSNHANLNLTDYYLAQNDVVWAYRGQLRNDTSLDFNWVNPVMIVDLPAEVEFVQDPEIGNFVQAGIPNKSTITSDFDPYNNENCITPEIAVTEDYNSTGRTRLRLDFPGCTIYGGLQQYAGIALYFSGRLKPGTAIDTTLVTDFRMYDENGLLFRCFGNDTIYKNWCGTRHTLTVSSFPSESFRTLESYLFAKGGLDTEYHRYPQTGNTGPNGQVDYEAYVINTGNVVHRHIDLIDVLPHLNDTSIVTSQSRDSSWEQELRGDVTVERLNLTTGEWVTVPAEEVTRGPYYSNSTNPCRLGSSSQEIFVDDTLAVLPSGCDPTPWKPVVADPLGMRSTGLRWIPTEGFGPNEELRVSIAAQQRETEESCTVFADSFGTGTARADLDPSTQTQFIFDAAGAVDPGNYALMRSLHGSVDESGTKWHNVSADFTPADTDGRMMVINATGIVGEIYRKTVSDLVIGADYAITVWVVNAQDEKSSDMPVLKMATEPAGGGTAYTSALTEPVVVADTVVWNAYTLGFTAAATSIDFVLSTTE